MQRRLKLGELLVERSETLSADGQAVEVPAGMVHHWTGAVLIPDAKLEEVLAWVQNYAEMERNFAEVERSELLNRNDDTFDIFLRLKRKKVLTVHYATEHRVQYREHGTDRVSSVSVATKIAELDQAGTTAEREKPDDENRGFLWRLRSYWRFEQGEGGVWVECESISLSRAIPKGAAWMIRGFVESVPRESLEAALEPLRAAFSSQ